MVKKETFVILGGGPAGIAAAWVADTNAADVILISSTPVGGARRLA